MDNITELVTDTFSAPTDTDKTVFNKDYYKAKKETDLGKEIRLALTIPPDSRTHDQIKLARLGLLKMESFAEYPVNMQEKICRCAFYQKIPPKRVVIRQGAIADSFYFIFSGQAMVTVLDEDKKTGDVKNRILAVLRDGTCFGELAFLYSTTRTATVTSLTDMELLSIGREDFYDIFMSNRGQEPEHIQFLRKCEFTKHWPIQILLQNPTSCVFHYYKRNQVIVSDSTKSEYIFIIKSGTCQVLKKLDNVKPKKLLKARPTMSKENFLTDTYKAKVDTGLKKDNLSCSSKSSNIPWSFTHLEESQVKEKVEPVFLQIQLLKAGDTFGLNILKFDETDVNLPNPQLSLVSNGSEVLMLKKDIFLKHANDKVKENIRHIFQPFATTKEMQKKLQTAADWNYFKSKHMNEIYSNLKKLTKSSNNLKI
ncbi:unnamed protein product [Brachionus calyciflorus]|uniref:Cyclic nucleotide-binding domain-containing protein n=1 Tax=Brachionus calyciflorus TaxID=104777 RepID=A0A813QG24_9BILA|nr:unnamed protein product [Brachionus calyciflorus]